MGGVRQNDIRNVGAGCVGFFDLDVDASAFEVVSDFLRIRESRALQSAGGSRVYVTDWRSACRDMCYFSIDTHLADLNVAIDNAGAPVDLIGLCQGGWLSLLYAARFPHKIRRLVLARAPIDTSKPSGLSEFATRTPLAVFREFIRRGQGLAIGKELLGSWSHFFRSSAVDDVLQLESTIEKSQKEKLRKRFDQWDGEPLDPPGTYYLEVVDRIFKQNQIATNRFMALGRKIDVADIVMPAYLLAASDDELVPPPQLLAAAGLLGTPAGEILTRTEPCGHLSLFIGAKTLNGAWREIAKWLHAGTR